MAANLYHRSKFYVSDNRTSIINGRIVSLNLEGSPATGFLFLKRELKTTWFFIEYSIASFRWQIKRSFQDIKDFYTTIHRDPSLALGRNLFQAPFPTGRDGDLDTMVLIERREMVENFIKEVLSVLDFKMYEPLDSFIEGRVHLMLLQDKLRVVIRNLRSFVAKKKLHFRLFKAYSTDLLNFVYAMENGIQVRNVSLCARKKSESGPPERWILWLDVCDEPGLSRLCLAPLEVFKLPKIYEDERLANGIFLSDIAEIRKGFSASFFRHYTPSWAQASQCVNVIASERNFYIQLDQEFSSPSQRFSFMDMLQLLVLQALTPAEVFQRRKVFRRADARLYDIDPSLVQKFASHTAPGNHMNKISSNSGCMVKMHNLSMQVAAAAGSTMTAKERSRETLRQDSETMLKLLLAGLDVDEETFSLKQGMRVVSKLLVYEPEQRLLLVKCKQTSSSADIKDVPSDDSATSGEESDSNGAQPHWQDIEQRFDRATMDRSISIDDICEVRLGKVSEMIDQSMSVSDGDDVHYISVIASASVLVLPIASKVVLNNFIRKFHAFLQMHRDVSFLASDTPALFARSAAASIGVDDAKLPLSAQETQQIQEDVFDLDVPDAAVSSGSVERRSSKKHFHVLGSDERSHFHSMHEVHSGSMHPVLHHRSSRSVAAIRRSSSRSQRESNSISEALHNIRNSSVDHY